MQEKSGKPDRLTITLAPGQREALEAFAERNHATLAFVARYALAHFTEENAQRQLRLDLKDSCD